MKAHATLTLVSIWMILLYSCSLPADEEEPAVANGDDTATASLPWEGNIDRFSINSKEGIRLNDTQARAGTAYATFPSATLTDTRWEFGVRLSFNPSANNFARFYLAASSPVLSGHLNGYYIQIGGPKDNVALYRQNDSKSVLLASGRELMKGINAPRLYVKVECDANGYWTFWTRLESESEYIKEKQVKDCSITTTMCCGVYCVYTPTRSQGISFHHICTSNGNITAIPPEPTEESGKPDLPAEVKGMILLNEVMYDNDSDGAEYIELYNPSPATITFPSLRLLRYVDCGENSTETKSNIVLQPSDGNLQISIPPTGYVCLTRSCEALVKKHHAPYENIIEISNMPQLTNEDSHLAIMTNESKPRLIDKCSYFGSMHNTGYKRNQGISLEKKSPELSSAVKKNWQSSESPTGGTPGMANSSIAANGN